MQLKNSDVETKAQMEDIKRASSCCLTRNETQQNNGSLHFVFLGSRAKLAEALRGFYAKAQLENVSL